VDPKKLRKLHYHHKNGNVFLTGVTAANLSSKSCAIVIVDELSKCPPVPGEATAASLIQERVKTFPQELQKMLFSSTPTHALDEICSQFQKGSQEYYYVPCPHCNDTFRIVWEMVWWDNDLLTAEDKAKSAVLICPRCDGKVTEKQRRSIVHKGEWIAHNPDAPRNHRSFQASEMYSLFSSLEKMTLKFLAALDAKDSGSMDDLRGFYNSTLGLPFDEQILSVLDPQAISELVDLERPAGVLPAGVPVQAIIMGVDTQDYSFYFSITALSGNDSYVLAQGNVPDLGAISKIMRSATFLDVQANVEHGIGAVFIDSGGHRTSEVYDFARANRGFVTPCMGFRGKSQNLFKFYPIDKIPGTDKPVIGGLQRLMIDTISLKDEFFFRLTIPKGSKGQFRLHSDADGELKNSLRSEYKDFKTGKYVEVKRFPNHYLDTLLLSEIARKVFSTPNLGPLTPTAESSTSAQLPRPQKQQKKSVLF
jgi:phage terminase large subunit GpA-like protein